MTARTLQWSGHDDEGNPATGEVTVDVAPTPAPGVFATLGVDVDYIRSLPTSGPEWARLKAQADAPYPVDHLDGATDGSGNSVAGAIVWLRTGDEAYRSRVVAALGEVQSIDPSAWWHAAANRKLAGWAIAGDLIGHTAPEWHACLRAHLTAAHQGHNRSGVMAKCAWHWDNNHGGAALSSYVAICAALGIVDEEIGGYPGGLSNAYKWLAGWLGDHTQFGHSDSTNPSYGSIGITDPPLSRTWQADPTVPYGVVPASSGAKSGAVPSDVIRDGGAYPTPGGSAKHYVYGNAGRRTVAAAILAANGFPQVWEVADRALLRWRQWCVDNPTVGAPEGAPNQHYDAIVNAVYGTSFPATGTAGGESIVGADWLSLGGAWPIRA